MSRRTRVPDVEVAVDPQADAPGETEAAEGADTVIDAAPAPKAPPARTARRAAAKPAVDEDGVEEPPAVEEPVAEEPEDAVAVNAAAIAELWRLYKTEGDPAVREKLILHYS